MSRHSSRFLRLVDEAKSEIEEVTVSDVKTMMDSAAEFELVDVREESEFTQGHLPNARHLSKGVLERDIERYISDVDKKIVLYCGGGFRSALAAENLQRMGYTNVASMDSGVRGWRQAGYSVDEG